MTVIINDLHQRLAYSEDASVEDFWQEIYRKTFPDLVCAVRCKGNTQSQRMGIDRIIHLSSGKTLQIDEKKRSEVWKSKGQQDILLEYISVDTKSELGWIEKDLQIDYIAYAIMPLKRVYFLPWQQLRLAWKENKDRWFEEYKKVTSNNKGYKTLSLAIPVGELATAIWRVMVAEI
jgi:hypothetical protein